jgi:hypothetical protein
MVSDAKDAWFALVRGSQPTVETQLPELQRASFLRILTIFLRFLTSRYPLNLGALFGTGRGFGNSDLLFERPALDNTDNISVERIIIIYTLTPLLA